MKYAFSLAFLFLMLLSIGAAAVPPYLPVIDGLCVTLGAVAAVCLIACVCLEV